MATPTRTRPLTIAMVAFLVFSVAAQIPAQNPPDTADPKPFRQSDMTLVVSVRHYLASAERSYYHLYLYSGDGKMIRQLTNVDKMSDVEPVLSPDGKQVCFRRIPDYEYPSETTGTYHLIADFRSGSRERKVAQPPEWYHPEREAEWRHPSRHPEGLSPNKPVTEIYPSPDSRYEIVLHYNWPLENSDPVGFDDFRLASWLVDRTTSSTYRVAEMRGFEELSSVCDSWSAPFLRDAPYLYEGPLKLAFFRCHLGSTLGASFYALDLNRKAFTKLTENGGYTIPIQRVPGFFYVCDERYKDLGYKAKTVNCSYLDFWDEKLTRTRYAPELSEFGGAAVRIAQLGSFVLPGWRAVHSASEKAERLNSSKSAANAPE